MAASDDKKMPEWVKSSGLVAIAMMMGGGGAYWTGNSALSSLQTKLGEFEARVSERLVKLEVKVDSLDNQFKLQDSHLSLQMENIIRKMVKPEAIK